MGRGANRRQIIAGRFFHGQRRGGRLNPATRAARTTRAGRVPVSPDGA
jgi:hypothetical protein